MTKEVVALLVADLHLSLKAPLARSVEPDWLATQAGYLDQLTGLTKTLAGDPAHPLPVICAGDVFDRHDTPPAAVNMALAHLPLMFAVPGQHDLPHHRYKDRKRSSYWTLVEAGRVTDLQPGKPVSTGPLRLWGFPYGARVRSCQQPHDLALDVAVVHRYTWTKHTGYPDAPKERRLGFCLGDFAGYAAVVIGDNHKPFDSNCRRDEPEPEAAIYNCGSFMRRKADEREHVPSVGLLYDNGTIERCYLDISNDKFLESLPARQPTIDDRFSDFLGELAALGQSAIDFSEAIKQALEREKVPDEVKQFILRALEAKQST